MSNTRARSFDEAAGVTAIRHPTLVNVSRIFPSDATMNIVYDWVGSLPPYPLYFKLCNFVCSCAQPSETVSKYTLSILNVVEIEEGLPFEESQVKKVERALFVNSNRSQGIRKVNDTCIYLIKFLPVEFCQSNF